MPPEDHIPLPQVPLLLLALLLEGLRGQRAELRRHCLSQLQLGLRAPVLARGALPGLC